MVIRRNDPVISHGLAPECSLWRFPTQREMTIVLKAPTPIRTESRLAPGQCRIDELRRLWPGTETKSTCQNGSAQVNTFKEMSMTYPCRNIPLGLCYGFCGCGQPLKHLVKGRRTVVSAVRPLSGMLALVYLFALFDQQSPAPGSRTLVRRLGCDRSGICP